MKSGTLSTVAVIMLIVCFIASIIVGKNCDSFWLGASLCLASVISVLPWFAIDKILEIVEELRDKSSPRKAKPSKVEQKEAESLEEAEELAMSEDSVPLDISQLK